MRIPAANLLAPLSAGALAISLLDTFIRLAPAERRAYFYNADLLYLPSLFADLAGGGSPADWRFSNAPYLFPDIALFLPLWALAPNMFIAIALFGAIQLILLTGGFAWLASRAAGPHAGALGLVCGAAFCAAIGRLGPSYDLAVVSVFHVGLLVVMPFALIAAGEMLTTRPGERPAWPIATLALLTGLTVASDPLYIFQAALPMALACALLALRGAVGRERAAQVLGAIGLSALAGIAAERLTQPYRGQVTARVSAADARAALDTLFADLPLLLQPWPWLGLALLSFVALSAWVLLGGLRSATAAQEAGVARLLALGTIVWGILIMPAVAVLTGKPTDRYFLNVLYLGPFLSWPLLIPPHPRPLAQRITPALPAAGALALLLIAAPALPRAPALGAYADYYPPLSACLDANAPRYGLRSGVAQYWQARPIEMLSRRGLRAVTLKQDLMPWHWLGSMDWFNRDIDFAVVDRSPEGLTYGFSAGALTKRFGPPAATFSCGDSDVYVYNRPDDVAFHYYLRRAMPYTLLDRPRRTILLSGAELPGPIGAAGARERVAQPGQKGYLVLSDWLRLSPGGYLLRVDYIASSPVEPGFVELSGRSGLAELELTGALPLQTGERSADIHFALDAPSQVQIQVYTSGRGQLDLDKIQLVRVW